MGKSFQYNFFLVKSLGKGKEDAYAYLVKTYHADLYGYALSLCSDHGMAQDIVQNVFIRTWEHRKKLDPQQEIKRFLFKATYNEFVNQYWKSTAVTKLESEFAAALAEAAEEEEDFMARRIACVKREIQNLPPRCKSVFLLSKEEGLTNHEISEYLGMSKRTVETQISKAYKILRDKIGERAELVLLLLFGNADPPFRMGR